MHLAQASLEMKNGSPRARALRAVRQWIADGLLEGGETLPPERDISLKLGVGLGTVQRVLKLLQDEGTIVKHAGRTRTVSESRDHVRGVLKDSVVVIDDWTDPFPALRSPGWSLFVTEGVLRGLGEMGLHAIVSQPRGIGEGNLDRLLASRPMGLIVPDIAAWGGDTSAFGFRALAAGVPVVIFGGEPGSESFDRVEPDHATGDYELTHWLLARGKKHIRQFWPFTWVKPWVTSRRRGYEQAMREAGLEPLEPIQGAQCAYPALDEALEFRSRVESTAGALVPFLLGDKPTDAIMAVNDGIAVQSIAAIRLLGKIPNVDVEVVGYDDFWEESPDRRFELVGPLATVDKNNVECGRRLVSLLVERNQNKLPMEPQIRSVKPTLRVLGSKSFG